ncbi:MAG: hypothetical protein ACOYBQ_05920 [Fluviibacter sp.]|jgi:hypothetical protein
MDTETRQMIVDAIETLVNRLHEYDAEIGHLQNLGFTSSIQYNDLRCRLDGIQIYGKNGEDFGLWDSYFEEVPYEDAVKEAEATGECKQIPKPYLADRHSGKIVSYLEGLDKSRLENLIEFVNETAAFGNNQQPLSQTQIVIFKDGLDITHSIS